MFPLTAFITCAAIITILRIISVFATICSSRRGLRPGRSRRSGHGVARRVRPVKVLSVLGSGGHTSEMMRLVSCLDRERYRPLIYVVAETDATSLERVKVAASSANNADVGRERGDHCARLADSVYAIPRSREVGQPYVSSVLTTIHSFFYALYVVIRTRPDLVLCNGPGTCLPIAYCALICRLAFWCGGNVVFVESFCRVKTLSLTGRLLYPVADRFFVHWPELKNRYPRSETLSVFRHDEDAEAAPRGS